MNIASDYQEISSMCWASQELLLLLANDTYLSEHIIDTRQTRTATSFQIKIL